MKGNYAYTPHAAAPAQMIAVIADDFTGAAEIGGIALRHGFKAMVSTSFTVPYNTEVLIIATNTRAESPENARKIIGKLTSQLLKLQPEFIFKKIDSVLRGNVADELLEQLQVSGKRRALIIPANPSLNRVIKDGVYYCDGLPLNRSSFTANVKAQSDSANVAELLGKHFVNDITIVSKGDELPATGLIIGNTIDETDLDYWASQFDQQSVLAGGADFFNSLLKNKNPNSTSELFNAPPLGQRKLYVCGSAFEASRQIVADACTQQTVVYMPANLFCRESDQQKLRATWEAEILNRLDENGTVIIAVDCLNCAQQDLPEKISKAFADVVKNLMARNQVHELFIEGGFTAALIIEKLKYQQFYPVQELAIGVIRMKVQRDDDVFLTLKPGSYKWPSSVWKI